MACWTFLFSKTVKLWGHFFRYPADIVFLPIYIGFGYFHGLIKLYGLMTLSEVSAPYGTPLYASTDAIERPPGAAETELMRIIESA